MSELARRARPALLGLLTLLATLACLASLACAPKVEDATPLWVDPGHVRTSAGTETVTVEVHNRTGVIRPIGGYAITGPDWGAFRFVDDTLPRTIPGRDSVEFTVEVSRAAFREGRGYRSGQATLEFDSDGHHHAVPIHFEAGPAPLRAGWLLMLVTAGLLVVGTLLWARARPSSLELPAGRLRARAAIAFAGAGLLALTLPLGAGACAGRLGAMVGHRELAQCRAGLGGEPAAALALEPGWLWLVLAMVLATVTAMASWRRRGELANVALPAIRFAAFALILAALALSLAPQTTNLAEWPLAQARARALFDLQVPNWGVLAQPIGFALAIALLVVAHPGDRDLATSVDAVAWSALVAFAFLGGWSVPGVTVGGATEVPRLVHGGALAFGGLVFVAKTALVAAFVDHLRTATEQTVEGSSRRLAITSRWLLPLALANLAVTLAL